MFFAYKRNALLSRNSSPRYANADSVTTHQNLLRLASKYQMDDILERAVIELATGWPMDLKEWEELDDRIQLGLSLNKTENPKTLSDKFIPEPVAAIQLAQQHRVLQILPAAYYHLSRISIDDDWDARHGAHAVEARTATTANPFSARWRLLSASELRTILRGRERLAHLAKTKAPAVFTPSLGGALHKGPRGDDVLAACAKGCEAAWNSFLADFVFTNGDILRALQQNCGSRVLLQAELCTGCMMFVAENGQNLRRAVWEELPRIFDFDV